MGFPVPWRRAKLAGVLVSCALAAVLGPGAAPCRAQGRVVTATATITPPATSPGGASELRVTVTIDAEWHVNAHVPSEPFLIPTELRLEAPAEVEVGDVAYPPGEERRFAFNPAKPLATYAGTITLTAPVRVKPDAPAGRAAIVRGTLRYQACNDTRCLPPDTVPVSAAIAVRAVAAGPPPAVGAGAGLLSASGGATFSPEAWFARGYLFTFAAVAALGALLNLTPCVYPLIAVTVAFFGGQGRGSRARVVGLAGVYVLGIAVTFSAMGAASALSGAAFGAALQRPAVLAFIAAALLALAGANFGLYQLRVPTALGRWAGRAGTGAAGALFMGLTMGLVAAPCVGPVVIGLLLFVGSRQDPLLGVALFFVLALGLGAPYVVLAALADSARRLPRSGGWLAWVEKLLGCVLVGLALFYLAPLLPAGLRRPAALGLLAAAGIYLGFLEGTLRESLRFTRFKRGVGIAALGIALWGLADDRDHPIAWQPLTPGTVAAAREAGRPAVIDFSAEWCIPCREMDETTFRDPAVVDAARHFVMLRADVTVIDPDTDELLGRYGVLGVPTYVFFTPAGAEAHRLVGYVPAETFVQAMQAAAGDGSSAGPRTGSAGPVGGGPGG